MSLEKQAQIVRIVVASPGDVQAERDALPAVIEELNKGIAADHGLRLELYRWETDAYPGFHAEDPQSLIDELLRIEDCDVLIGIFWKRFGTPTKDAQSGTEHEIQIAYEVWKKHGRPQIMVYFNQKAYTPKTKGETDQWGQVLEFKESFPKDGLWWPYKGKAQFEKLARNHLSQFIRHQSSKDKPQPQATSARSLDELIKAYRDHLTDRVSRVRIFGEAESRPLRNVFVELTIVEEYERPTIHAKRLGMMDAEMRRRRDPLAREEEGPETGAPDSSREKVKRNVKPDELLRGRTQAVIVGAPGCGKTTLLRYLALKTLEEGKRFPVFLELKSVSPKAFHDAGEDLATLIFEKAIAEPLHLSPAEGETFKEHFFARLAAGEARCFLNGLDEVRGSEFFPNLCQAVNQLVGSSYGKNNLVISTRPYALQTRFEGLKEMEIAPLSRKQINEFLDHYYADDSQIKTLAQLLRRRRELREMARVPFLLGVIAHLYRQQGDIVGERLELYRQIVQQLVDKLDREKGVERFLITFDSDGSLKRDFLKQLAYERLFDDQVEKDAERLVFTGDVILEKARRFCKGEVRSIAPRQLKADVIATPLLREVVTDAYAFAHLTIQEYLAATVLAEHEDCEKVFCRAYFNPTLAEMEVLPMTLGLVCKPDDLYTALEQLPESLNFTNLRLCARGLAYASNTSRERLIQLTDRLIEFIVERNADESGYLDPVLRSFSVAGSQSLKFMTDRIGSLLRKDEDRDVRWRAEAALGQLGSAEAVTTLLQKLTDEDSGVRGCAAAALGQIGSAEAVTPLVQALKDEDSDVRWCAAAALGQIGSAEAGPALVQALKDEDSGVRGCAAAALGQIGSAEAGPALVQALKDEDSFVRSRVAEALGQIGSEAVVPALLQALKDESSDVRWRAVKALGQIEDEGLTLGLLRALAHEEVFVRRKAAEVVGYYASGEDVLRELSRLAASDPVDEVRSAASDALEKYRRKLHYVAESG
jgi:hypothetical protein